MGGNAGGNGALKIYWRGGLKSSLNWYTVCVLQEMLKPKAAYSAVSGYDCGPVGEREPWLH